MQPSNSDVALRDHRLPPRFWAKVEATSDGCWRWTAGCDSSGYGTFGFDSKKVGAHRLAYQTFKGPIPDGQQVDHTCHNRSTCHEGNACPHRRCVNPAHLEAVTQLENQVRSANTWTGSVNTRTHCRNGHGYTEDNIIARKSGRACRTCAQARVAAYTQTPGGKAAQRKAKAKYNEAHRAPERTHCKNGHELREDAVYRYGKERICKQCQKDRGRKYLASNPAAVEKKLASTRAWRERQRAAAAVTQSQLGSA